MKSVFNKSFFKLLLGLASIFAAGFVILVVVGFYEVEIKNAASSFERQ